MIYDPTDSNDPIRQGDIFVNVPRVDLSLSRLAAVGDEEITESSWEDILEDHTTSGGSGSVNAVLPLKLVSAIVVSQDCDAARAEYVTLAEIIPFVDCIGGTEPSNAKKWQSKIVGHARTNQRFFYLPAGGEAKFEIPMAADFRIILRLQRAELVERPNLRLARLKDVALDHFRESLAYFFRRYAFNEWYPLTKEQFDEYAKSSKESVEPYDWQKE